jgi:hypothetical protein
VNEDGRRRSERSWNTGDRLRRAAPFVVCAIALLGLLLRLPGLLDYWLNPDEGIYYSTATWPAWERFWAEVSSNAHPPLFFVLMRVVSGLSLDLTALRAPSLVFGVLAIPALYLATRELLGTGAGLLAALGVAVSVGAITQSQVIRPYAMQLSVLGFALWFLARFANRRATRDLVAWGALLWVAVLLHYSSWLAVAAMTGATIVLLGAGRIGRQDALRMLIAQAPAVATMAVLWFGHVATRLIGGDHLRIGRETWLRAFFQDDLAGLWSGLVGLLRYWFGTPHDALAVVVLAVGLGVTVWRRQLLLASLVTFGLGLAAALSLLALYPFGESRHSTYLIALLIPCLANGLRFLVVGRSRWHLAAAAVLVLLALYPQPLRDALGTSAIPLRRKVEHITPRRSLERAELVLSQARATPGVILVDEQTYFALMPLFHPARLEMRTLGRAEAPRSRLDGPKFAGSHTLEDAVISRFRWGAADVVVIHAWRLVGNPRRLSTASHVFDFLRQADQAFPDLRLSQRSDVRLFFAGWGARLYRPLEALDRSLGGGCVSSFAFHRGFGWSQLDAARCLELIAR